MGDDVPSSNSSLPLQSLSIPSQTSLAPGNTALFASSQSSAVVSAVHAASKCWSPSASLPTTTQVPVPALSLHADSQWAASGFWQSIGVPATQPVEPQVSLPLHASPSSQSASLVQLVGRPPAPALPPVAPPAPVPPVPLVVPPAPAAPPASPPVPPVGDAVNSSEEQPTAAKHTSAVSETDRRMVPPNGVNKFGGSLRDPSGSRKRASVPRRVDDGCERLHFSARDPDVARQGLPIGQRFTNLSLDARGFRGG